MKILLTLVLLISCATEKWNYKDLENWEGECQTGKMQSPIAIENTKKVKLQDFKFHYQPMAFDRKWIHKTIHGIPKDKNKSYVSYKGKKYYFQDLHFHFPSSHAFPDRFYAAEIHLVHYSEKGMRLVLASLYKFGQHNEDIQNTLNQEKINPRDLLPKNMASYRYIGSLTTPPCTEGVFWVVMKTPLTLGRKQLERVMNPGGGFNNRPPQPRNNRIIYETY
jgi:carbonic anhydrase